MLHDFFFTGKANIFVLELKSIIYFQGLSFLFLLSLFMTVYCMLIKNLSWYESDSPISVPVNFLKRNIIDNDTWPTSAC